MVPVSAMSAVSSSSLHCDSGCRLRESSCPDVYGVGVPNDYINI